MAHDAYISFSEASSPICQARQLYRSMERTDGSSRTIWVCFFGCPPCR